MKFVLLSDGHFLWYKPIARVDNPRQTQFDKWEFILDYARKNKAYILQAGDLFDCPRSWYLLPDVMDLFKKYNNVPIFCVFGQHDTYLYNEKTRKSTSLGILEKAGLVTILESEPLLIKGVKIYGCHYGQEIPVPDKSCLSILVIHAPIAEYAAWPGQKYIDAMSFLKEHKFNLILCADIHQRFTKSYQGRFIVNAGPLLRKEATAYNFSHEPIFYVYDTDDPTLISQVEIPHLPADQVLSRSHIDYAKEAELVLQSFVDSVEIPESQEDTDEGSLFVRNLWALVRANDVKQSVVTLLSEVINVRIEGN